MSRALVYPFTLDHLRTLVDAARKHANQCGDDVHERRELNLAIAYAEAQFDIPVEIVDAGGGRVG